MLVKTVLLSALCASVASGAVINSSSSLSFDGGSGSFSISLDDGFAFLGSDSFILIDGYTHGSCILAGTPNCTLPPQQFFPLGKPLDGGMVTGYAGNLMIAPTGNFQVSDHPVGTSLVSFTFTASGAVAASALQGPCRIPGAAPGACYETFTGQGSGQVELVIEPGPLGYSYTRTTTLAFTRGANIPAVAPVPEPAAILLAGAGLLAMVALACKPWVSASPGAVS